MATCHLSIELDDADAPRSAGAPISGTVVVRTVDSVKCSGLEVTSYWATHGRGNIDKGEVDKTVVFEGEWGANQTYRYPFQLKTAAWPPTYYGNLLNVSHFVLARARVPWASDPKTEREFQVVATKSPDDLQATAAPPTASRSVVAWVFGGALLLIFGVLFSFLLLFLVPILLIGGAIFWFFRVFLPSQVTGSIQCNVEPQRLTAAESVRGTMRFTPRREVRVNGVRCTVTCKERCVSGSGSNRQTHLHEVFRHTEQLSEARTLRVAMPESFEFAVPLPADAPLSLKFGNNELTWNVELRIDIPKWPDWVKEFPLTIVPSATAAATAALVLGESASHGAPADSAGRSAPLGGASDDTWFDEVARQIIQSRHDSSRMQLVLDAVRDHRFTIRVDIDQRLSDPPGSAPLERGSWMLAHYRPQDLALCLVWPPGQPPPAANTYDWCCPAQILAFDDPLDRLVMRVLPSAA